MSRLSDMIYYFREGDYLSFLIMVLSTCFVVFCCLPIHELAHALVADKCGDDTARIKGRLTVNPFAHLDILGTIMIFLFGVGYAKPVPVNPARLKHPRRDMALIALAGPVSNLIMGFIAVFLFYIFGSFNSENPAFSALSYFFYIAASVNVTLAVFNLLPIPPLDGSRIFSSILPDKIYFKIERYERYIMIGFIIILFTGILDGVISFISGGMMDLISIIPKAVFGE